MTDALLRAGELAAQTAEKLFALNVYDPPANDQSARAIASRSVIDHVLTQAGWGFATPYHGPEPQWCGLFAATCWRAAGLNPKWLATYWASTYRLALWAQYRNFDAKHPNPAPPPSDGVRLYVDLQRATDIEPRAGDVVIVGDGNPAVGDHITVCCGFDAKTGAVSTVSGNGVGLGPDGKRREGIVRRDFKPGDGYKPMWLVRPAFDDLFAEMG
jgi:hypothetical protein